MMVQTGAQSDIGKQRSLVAGVLSGPVIWAVYFMIGYLLVEASCRTGFLGGQVLGLTVAVIVVIVLTLLALGVVTWSGLLAYRCWQRAGGRGLSRTQERPEDGWPEVETAHPTEESTAFLSLVGFLLSGLFGLLIVATGLAVVVTEC